MAKTETISIRIEPELKAALTRAAEDDRRTLGQYVHLILENHVKAWRAEKRENRNER